MTAPIVPPPLPVSIVGPSVVELERLVSFDFETYLFGPGRSAPPIVCGSAAWFKNGELKTGIFDKQQALQLIERLLSSDKVICFANAPYDLACAAEANPDLLPIIFRALEEGRIHDVLTAEALNAIYHGTLGIDPDTGKELRSPSTGKPVKRYSLEIVTYFNLGRVDAKANDIYRKSYALLEGVPIERWPEEARTYPQDDAKNTLEVAVAQIFGRPGRHDFAGGQCIRCGADYSSKRCSKAPRTEPHQNLQNLAAQCEAAFALHLGAAWGIRTDAGRVARLEADVNEKHRVAVERFQKKGWIRPDGTEDQAAIKKSIALAYGVSGKCPRCKGTGLVEKFDHVDCRGEKVKGRYQGCLGPSCPTCSGKGKLIKSVGFKTCKVEGEGDEREGCDGTGLDLESASILPRSEKGGVKTDRDACMESGDDDISDYADDVTAKIRTTYVPYLKRGLSAPITLQPNVLVASGRCSYSDPIHQFPRKGGVRDCIVPLPGRYLCSTDYAAGELCALAQVTYWYEGESVMRDVINETRDPGSLHTMLAAQILGTTLADVKARIKAGDKQAKDFRQAAKCFHPDTEILTRHRGWVKISELTMNDEVATVYPVENRKQPVERKRDDLGRFPKASGDHRQRDWWKRSANKIGIPSMNVVWERPLRLTTRKATEGLVHLKNNSIDLRVTPDHRMLTYGSTKLLKVVEAKDFGHQRGWFNAGMWNGGEVEADERLLRLAVAAQADGNYIIKGAIQNKIRFGFSKQRKIDRLASMLRPGEYVKSVSTNGVGRPLVSHFKLTKELSDKVKALLDPDKTLPWWWMELKPHLRNAVLDEAAYWDSHMGKRCYYFSTTLKKNSEVLQAIASVTGRKATYTKRQERETPHHEPCDKLTIRSKYDTRGEHVNKTKIDYFDDVFCLTVKSGSVLVRDGGIPVVTQQCSTFGLPGGLGAVTLVTTNRRKAAGTTKLPNGEEVAGIRFCVLMGGAEFCGVEKITVWNKRPCPPVCKKCVQIVEEILKPSFFKTYPEVKKYLDRISAMTRKDDGRAKPIPAIAWNHEKKIVEILRRRGECGYTDGANQGFQGLLSDIGKRAFVRMTKEGYLGRKRDGSDSPLAGSRFMVFAHDEPIAEIPIEVAHEAAPRIAEIMIESGRELAPDVFWWAEPALMTAWYKDAEPVRDSTGKLIPWQPKG